jgi:hypothetical protein
MDISLAFLLVFWSGMVVGDMIANHAIIKRGENE